jgi:uncharacterized membrane protein (DUF485 family)
MRLNVMVGVNFGPNKFGSVRQFTYKLKATHLAQSKYSSEIYPEYHRTVQYIYRYIHDRSLSWLGTFTFLWLGTLTFVAWYTHFLAWYTHFPGLVHSLSWHGTFTFLAWYTHFPGLVHSLSLLGTFTSIRRVKLVSWDHTVKYQRAKNCFFQSVTLNY